MLPFSNSFGQVMFNIVPIMIAITAIIVFSLVIVNIIKGIKTWNYNNAQPVLKVIAKVVSKRIEVSHNSSHTGGNMNQVNNYDYTTYYVTFEVESGDRMEFKLKGDEYGLLVEGDKGNLNFQGSRYLGFNRII